LHVPIHKRTKLESIALKAILVGYDTQTKRYICFEPKSRKFLINRNICFNELKLEVDRSPDPSDFLEDLFIKSPTKTVTKVGKPSKQVHNQLNLGILVVQKDP
jgi:hypothetical protein